MPVVPGVVLLSQILTELTRQLPQLHVRGIKKLKFLKMLLPDHGFTVEFAVAPLSGAQPDSVRFKCWQADDLLAEGNLSLRPAGQLL
jgi:hypothetical protein